MPRMILGFLMLALGMNATAQEACTGGWQYEQLGFCANSDAGCKTEVPVYKSCEAKVTDADLGCGPESYESCSSMSCPGSIAARDYTATSPKGCDLNDKVVSYSSTAIPYPPYTITIYKCNSPNKPATCENISCTVKKWKSCRHDSCGLEKNNCTEYKQSYSSKCGSTPGLLTEPGMPKPASDGKVPNDSYALGSTCLTCNDIPLDTDANTQRRFECLAKGIELAEASKSGYSFKVTINILQQLQTIGLNYSSSLTEKQSQKLNDILDKYNF